MLAQPARQDLSLYLCLLHTDPLPASFWNLVQGGVPFEMRNDVRNFNPRCSNSPVCYKRVTNINVLSSFLSFFLSLATILLQHVSELSESVENV